MTSSTALGKDELCYKILVLTAKVDGYFHPREAKVIEDFFSSKKMRVEKFAGLLNEIKNIPSSEFETHLQEAAKEYVECSKIEERENLILYTLKLINADEKVFPKESLAFTLVYNILNTNKN